jgi:pilus assembly protein CpaF
MARYAADLPVDVIEAQIGTAFDMIVQTARSSDGRRFVSHIDEVEYDRGRNACAVIPLYARDDFEDRGTWAKAPSWLSFDACRGWARPEEVASWMQRTECC